MTGALVAFSSAAGAGQEKRPQITTQPQNVTALAGREAMLFARAYGAGSLTFQWLRNGVALAKADEPVLKLSSISDAEAGAYQIVVSSPYGKATSDVARVTVVADGGGGFTPAAISCNAVGFINLSLAPGFTLAINQLAWDGPGGPTVSNMLGLLPDGMAIQQVVADGFKANAMLVRWSKPDAPLSIGDVFFVFNPFDSPVTVTFVGEVAQGNLDQALPAGYSIAGSLVPQAGAVGSLLGMPQAPGDEVWRWVKQSQSYVPFRLPIDVWEPGEPVVSVGEAFVVRKEFPVIWRRFFTINLLGGCPSTLSGPVPRVSMPATDGQLHFFTYNPDPDFGRVRGVGSDYFGQLYAGLSTDENQLFPCGVPVRFFGASRSGYVDGGMVTAPGLPAGRTVQTQLRIWRAVDGASYEEALATGCATAKSEIVPAQTASPLVDGQPGIPARPVNHFPTFKPSQIPFVIIDPVDGLVAVGQTATLTVAGVWTSGFQWFHNNVAIAGATGPQLVLPNVQRSDAGQYSVVVSNGTCVLTSPSVSIRPGAAPQIVSTSSNQWFTPGQNVQLDVVATGDELLHYQWFTGADPLPSGTNDILSLPAWEVVVGIPYSVTVLNDFGTVTSGPIMVRARPALRIERSSPGTFRLVWPREAAAFALEQSASLGSANSWQHLTQPVVLTETECAVSVPGEAGTNRWFRLRLP